MINKLSSNEKKLIEDYIAEYASRGEADSSLRAPLEKILAPWAEAKKNLYTLFGNQLMIKKEVEFPTSDDVFCEEISQLVRQSKFISNYWHWFYDLPLAERDIALTELIYSGIYHPYSPLKIKGYKLPTPDGKTIDIYPNSKPIKVLGKIAAAFGLENFEDFRLAHSRIFNKKSVKGEFILSIHPLDYMTMSDNDCNWESCMSWMNRGCYRAGTIEMMNSPYVVVGYLNASAPMPICGQSWTNKKWRCLFIVSDQFICKIKSYPYQNTDYEKFFINELANLTQRDYEPEILDWDGESAIEGRNLYFYTNHMYNDFGSGVSHWIKLHPSFRVQAFSVEFDYSGLSECMWCGATTYIDSDDELICEDCIEACYCDICGDRLFPAEQEIYSSDGVSCYCEDCWINRTFVDSITGNRYDTEYEQIIHAIPNAQKFEKLLEVVKNSYDLGFIAYHYCGGSFFTVHEDSDLTLISSNIRKCARGLYGYFYYVDQEDCNPEYQCNIDEEKFYHHLYSNLTTHCRWTSEELKQIETIIKE